MVVTTGGNDSWWRFVATEWIWSRQQDEGLKIIGEACKERWSGSIYQCNRDNLPAGWPVGRDELR